MFKAYGQESKIFNIHNFYLKSLFVRKPFLGGFAGAEFIADEYVFDSNEGLVSIKFSKLLDAEEAFILMNNLESAKLIRAAYEMSLHYHEDKPMRGSVNELLDELEAENINKNEVN